MCVCVSGGVGWGGGEGAGEGGVVFQMGNGKASILIGT